MTKVIISRSFYEKMDQIPEEIQGEVEEKLFAISRDLAHYSPVDTGAFVNSWSVSTSPFPKRSFSSHNRPKAPVKNSEKAKALSNMTNDIIAARPEGQLQTSVGAYYHFTNGAPHAVPVEKNAALFAIIRRKHG